MSGDRDSLDPVARAEALVRLFCAPRQFGQMRGIAAERVPEPQRSLLDHKSHMTVAMERAHGGEVRLRVLATSIAPAAAGREAGHYAREIVLENREGQVVLFGIVRLDLAALDQSTAAAVLAARRPLGRILVEAGILRDVHSVELVEIIPGPHWAEVPGLCWQPGGPVFGRVAEIQLNGRAAVSLLETLPR